MLKKSILAGLVVLLIGCAPTVQLVSDYKVGRSVENGVRTSARVGDVVFSEYEYISGDGARILSSISKKYGLVRHQVQAGTTLTGYFVNGKKKYCTSQKTVMDPIVGPWNISCFSDRDNDGKFESVSVNVGDSDTDIPPTRYKVVEVSLDQSGFKYELIYQGKSEDVVHMTYREYKDNLARPAFQQDLKYTITSGEDNTISFRGVEMVIHEATNNSLVYTLISGFQQ